MEFALYWDTPGDSLMLRSFCWRFESCFFFKTSLLFHSIPGTWWPSVYCKKLDDEANCYLENVCNSPFPSFSGWLALGFKVSVCFFRCVWFWGCCPFRFFVAKESVYSLDPRPIKPPKMVVKILVVTGVLGRGTTEISPNMCLINT